MSVPFSPVLRRPLAAAVAVLLATTACEMSQGEGSAGAPTAEAAGVTSEALQAAVKDEPLRRFYEARQWQSAWSDEKAEQLLGALRNSVRHGFEPATLTGPIDQARGPVDREVALSRAAMVYAEALAHGRTDPSRLFEVYTLPRNQVDVPAGLAEAVTRGNAPEWMDGLAPQDEEYRALSDAYVQHVQAAQQQAQPAAGQQTSEVKGQEKGAQSKEKSKQEKIKQAEQATPAAARDRAAVLAVNLERRRWLPRNPEATRIDVNTAGTFLKYIRDNQVVDQRVVVNGEPGWETPQLGSPIYRLAANPDWTVPESIEKDELASLSEAQLQRRNMSRKNGRLVQEPGPENALGLVKFDMQNEHAIYLHDTPSKGAFQQARRHLSHGCVRVNDALGFARMLAEHAGKLDEFNAAQNQQERKTTFIDLGEKIPVRLLYHTAYLDKGELVFQPDPYGWDATVAQALGMAAPAASRINQDSAAQKRQRRGGDIGP